MGCLLSIFGKNKTKNQLETPEFVAQNPSIGDQPKLPQNPSIKSPNNFEGLVDIQLPSDSDQPELSHIPLIKPPNNFEGLVDI